MGTDIIVNGIAVHNDVCPQRSLNMKRTLFVILSLTITMPALAGTINLQNGNYTITFSDMVFPWKHGEIELSRIYNSGSSYKGFFGYGFGSRFEHKLVQNPDGSVILENFGSGATQVFTNENYQQAQISNVADQIIQKLPGTERSEKTKEELISNYFHRQRLATKFKIQTPEVPEGTRFSSFDVGQEWLTKTKDGWEVDRHDGSHLFFDKEGKIAKELIKGKYLLVYNYNEKKRLDNVTDESGKALVTFTFNSEGLATQVRFLEKAWVAQYTYKFHLLIESTDAANHSYKYSYDKRDNLTKILTADGKTEEIEYDARYRDRVVKYKSIDDVLTNYNFVPLNQENPEQHFSLDITKHFVGTRAPSSNTSTPFHTSKYTFFFKTYPDGRKYLTWHEVSEYGEKTKTEYGDPYGLPTAIIKGDKKTMFEYYPNGLLKKKVFPNGEAIELTYNDKYKKVSAVTRGTQTLQYEYDNLGNLKKATDASTKENISLEYDTKQRITKISSSKKSTLLFEYQEGGKPTKIVVNGKGTLLPVYDAQGNIIDMKSSNGRKLTIEAQETFNTLIQMIKPAGVTFGFGEQAV